MSESAIDYTHEEKWEIAPLGIAELAAQNIELMKQQAEDLTISDDGTGYQDVREAHIQAKNYSTRVKQRLDELNKPLNEKRRKNNEMASKLQNILTPIIDTLGTKRGGWEAKEAAAKAEREKVEVKRISDIKEKIDKMADTPTTVTGLYDSDGILQLAEDIKAREIIFDDFQEFTEEAIKVRDRSYLMLLAMHENLKKAETEAHEAEIKRQAQKKEEARIKKEREEIEAEKKRIADANAEIERKKREERETKEAEAKRKVDEEVAAKKAEEDRLKTEADVKAKAEKEAAEKEASERKEAESLAAIEAARPYLDKLKDWATNTILKLSVPKGIEDQDKAVCDMAMDALNKIYQISFELQSNIVRYKNCGSWKNGAE